MKRLRAYKTELHLNNKERSWCVRCCGAARWCYNWGLAAMVEAYEQGRKTSVLSEKKRLNAIKDEVAPWLRDLPYEVLEGAFRNLDTAYKNFFRRIKKGEVPGFPKFKSRKNGLGTFTLRSCIHVTETAIKLPRIGWLQLKEHGYLPTSKNARILSATISERAGHWYVSVQIEENVSEPIPATGEPIGVDFGLKELAVVSDGRVYENPRPLRDAMRKVKRLQREVARRKKGSKNRAKSVYKLAKAHKKVADTRRWWQHQVSHELVRETQPSVIVLETLNVSGMQKNHHLAQAISDVGFYELARQIEYKAAWEGTELMRADMWYPSSKTCSQCGHVKTELSLSDREYVCSECGSVMDRDLNAAINLKNLAVSVA